MFRSFSLIPVCYFLPAVSSGITVLSVISRIYLPQWGWVGCTRLAARGQWRGLASEFQGQLAQGQVPLLQGSQVHYCGAKSFPGQSASQPLAQFYISLLPVFEKCRTNLGHYLSRSCRGGGFFINPIRCSLYLSFFGMSENDHGPPSDLGTP